MTSFGIKTFLSIALPFLCVLAGFFGMWKIRENPRKRERRWILTLLIVSLLWTLITVVQFFSKNPLLQRILYDLEWVCIILLPSVFLMLVLEINRFIYMMKLAAWGFIFAMPVAMSMAIYAMNPEQSFLGRYIPEGFIVVRPELLWILYLSYLAGLLIFGFYYIFRLAWLRNKKLFRDGRPMLIAFLITGVLIAVDQTGWLRLAPLELTNLAVIGLTICFSITINHVQETDLKQFGDQPLKAAMPTPIFLEQSTKHINPFAVKPQQPEPAPAAEKLPVFTEEDTSNPLVKALYKITAQTSSFVDTEGVLTVMGEELKRLGVLFIFCTLPADQKNLTIKYASVLPIVRKRVERLFGSAVPNLEIPVEGWPLLNELIEKRGTGFFTNSIIEEAHKLLRHLPSGIVDIIFHLVGITENTVSATVVEPLQDGRFALVSFWGNYFRSNDLPTFARYSAQMVNVYNRALQFEQQRDQAKELERANRLVQALGNITARASSAIGTSAVLDALDVELGQLGLQYLLMFTDAERQQAELRKVTMKRSIEENLGEKIFQIASDLVSTRERWPAPITFCIDELKPYYTRDFMDFLPQPVYQKNQLLIDLALKMMNTNQSTGVIMVPQRVPDGRVAVFAVWGDGLLPTDISTFKVFTGQITNAIIKEQLHEAGQEKASEVERANQWLEALHLVAASVSSSPHLDGIMATLGEELKKIQLNCAIILTEGATHQGTVRYFSIDSMLINQLEQIAGHMVADTRLDFSGGHGPFERVLTRRENVYEENFAKMVASFAQQYTSEKNTLRVLRLIKINEQTKGFVLPLEINQKLLGCLVIWGDALRQSDLSTFAIFSQQIAIAFDNAQLVSSQQQQAFQLHHSNQLLAALGHLSVPVGAATEAQAMLTALHDEFVPLGLEFAYLQMNEQTNTINLVHISLKNQLMNVVNTMTNLLPDGKTFHISRTPTLGQRAMTEDEIIFIESFQRYAGDTLNLKNSQLINRILKLANMNEKTTGVIVPIHRTASEVDLLVVWGDSLNPEDVNAFLVFKQQAESVIEINRLYRLAEREIAERETAQKEYQGLFENAHDAILISEFDTGQILEANDRALRMFGYSRQEFLEMTLRDITMNVEKLRLVVKQIQASQRPESFELIQFSKGSSEPMDIEVNASVVTYQGRLMLQSIHRDVTERRKMEEKLRYDSLHDALTGLPNRTLFLDRLEHVIARSIRRNDYSFCVLYFDLDRFKDVNDSLGHLAGDDLLKLIATELITHVRETDTIARMGGDEFAVLMEDVHELPAIEEYCQRILNIIHQPFEIMGAEVLVSGSIGVTIGKPEVTSAEDYLRDADIALYRAKGNGKNRYSIFDVSMRVSVIKRLEIENNLRRAIQNDEFFLVYQPVINLVDEQLVGFEVLLRWQQAQNGLIPPAEFIPVAEDIRIINQIGHWVLETAFAQFAAWELAYPRAEQLRLHVNISAVQLLRPDFPQEVAEVLAKHSIHAQQIAFEITETASITDQLLASEQVDILKQMGIQIYLDDYGTGYSSLSLINLFKVDALKIDRQFIINHQDGLVRAIIAMGSSVGLKVVAEGVETQDHYAFLKQAGCHQAQGYFFARPLSVQDAEHLIQKGEEQSPSPMLRDGRQDAAQLP